MSSKKWFPNEDEVAFWERETKNVKQKVKSKIFIKEPCVEKPTIKYSEYNFFSTMSDRAYNELVLNDHANIDHRTINNIKRSLYPIDSQIDLHGCNLENALRALELFVLQSWQKKYRMLLIITGKGHGSNSIRDMMIKWLNYKNIRPYILRVSMASAKHGADGAFYVLLKRDREYNKTL